MLNRKQVSKGIALSFCAILFVLVSCAQSIRPQSINCNGTSMYQTNGSLSFTVGELVVLTQIDQEGGSLGGGLSVGINAVVSSDFEVSESTICESSQVSFIDKSQGGPTSWSWSFPGGIPNISTEQNPSVSYLSSGTYPVSLTVSNGTSSDQIIVQSIIVVLPNFSWYLDVDGDGYGVSELSLLDCTQPYGYVLLSGDCNDASSSTNPGVAEVCGNSINDDCDAAVDEGCGVILAANDNQDNAQLVVPVMYPSCLNIIGDLALASSQDAGGEDLWYTFTATTNAVRIVVSGITVTNSEIEVIDNNGNPVGAVEDASSNNGNEIFISDDMIIGETYDVAVRNAGGNSGTFTFCIQTLPASTCDNGSNFTNLCNLFKADWTGTSSYTVLLESISNPGNFYTCTSTGSSLMPLNNFVGVAGNTLSGRLRYGQSYSVAVSANYNLTDAGGNTENYSSNPSSSTCVISIGNQPLVNLGSSYSSSGAGINPRNVNSYVMTNLFVCGVQTYTWEFVQVDPLTNVPLGSTLPIYWTSPTSSRYLQLKSSNIPGIAAGKRYRVKVRPNFTYGSGTDDTSSSIFLQMVSSAGIALNSESDTQGIVVEERIESMDLEFMNDMTVYPNPSNGSFINLNLEGIDESNIMIDIIDSQGRKVYSQSNVITTNGFVRIEFENQLAAGLYTVLISLTDEILTEKVVVKN